MKKITITVESAPGVGKTALAYLIADTLRTRLQRGIVQDDPDLHGEIPALFRASGEEVAQRLRDTFPAHEVEILVRTVQAPVQK